MPLICICSPKGGVGKTTITANLAYSLARNGYQVLAIDFNNLNLLRLHFGIPLTDPRGLLEKRAMKSDWQNRAISINKTIQILPYGVSDTETQHRFDRQILSDDLFLPRQLKSLLSDPQRVILANFPTGCSAALQSISSLASGYLVPILADSASIALQPQIEKMRWLGKSYNDAIPYYLILNQLNPERTVSQDVANFSHFIFKDKLIGQIHTDECVPEAFSMQKSVFDFNPVSAAAYDIEKLAQTAILKFSLARPSISHHKEIDNPKRG